MKPREVEQAVEIAFQVPGLYRRAESAFLYKLARRKGLLVELGCYMGRSTSLLLQAAAIWEAEVVSIDAFVALSAHITPSTPEKWSHNLEKVGLTPPELIIATTDEAFKTWDREISMLFIDASHEYKQVARDIEQWSDFVKVGGTMALHDMFYPSITGVAYALAEWWDHDRDKDGNPNWELIGLQDFTIAFRRIQ